MTDFIGNMVQQQSYNRLKNVPYMWLRNFTLKNAEKLKSHMKANVL